MNTPRPQPTESRKSLVQQWTQILSAAKKFWKHTFDLIEEEQKFVSGKQTGELDAPDAYQANITRRLINQVVASAYAKNPRAKARRRERLEFSIYNGDPQSIAECKQRLAQAQMAPAAMDAFGNALPPPINPADAALLADYEEGMAERQRLDRIGKTLELLFDHQIETQNPPFKRMMKRTLRRACVCRAGWVKISYKREEQDQPTSTAASSQGFYERMRDIKARMAEIEAGDEDANGAAAEEIKLLMRELTADQAVGMVPPPRQGIEFDFPGTLQVIVDPATRNLATLDGCRWLAQEYLIAPAELMERYGANVKEHGAKPYCGGTDDRTTLLPDATAGWTEESKALVWEIWDRETGLRYMVCDGYDDLLEEPGEPVPRIERFFPLFAQTLSDPDIDENKPEADLTCYPPSLVRLVMPMQNEWNRQRRSLQSHRISNTPVYGLGGNATEADAKRLAEERRGPTVIRFEGMQPGDDVGKFLQRLPTAPVDPALYDIGAIKEDILMVVGAQEANLGPTSNATATEASIAEGSRLSSTSSIVDEIDDMLSELAQAAGEMLLMEMPASLVRELVGRGAVWPELDRETIRKRLFLEVQASSTGRPNRQVEAQNFQLLAPILMQIPGIRPGFMAAEAVKRLDDRIDLEEAFADGAPSVSALNTLSAQPAPVPVPGAEEPVSPEAAGMPPQMEAKMMASAGLRE